MVGGKGLATLVLLTAVVGAAAWGLRARSRPDAGEALPARVFPELSARLNDVSVLSIVGHDEQFTVRRTGETWGLDEKEGHPVRFEKVKGLLVGLSELRPLERKTASAALHGKLGVQSPSAEGATSSEVTATGADGTTLAALIVGNAGAAPRTRYVRKSGEDQSWLVQGELEIDGSAKAWLDTEVTRLEPADVSRVTVTHPDGEVLVAAKAAKDDPVWTIEGVPEGREPKNAGVGRTVAGALEWLDYDDVAAASRQSLPESERVTAVFETWDGLRVTVTSAHEPAPAPAEDAETPAETPAEPAEGESEDEGETQTESELIVVAPEPTNWIAISVEATESATEEARAEASKLQARLSPWVYQVGQYKASTLRQRLEDVTQPKAEPAPEPEPAPADGEPSDSEPSDDGG